MYQIINIVNLVEETTILESLLFKETFKDSYDLFGNKVDISKPKFGYFEEEGSNMFGYNLAKNINIDGILVLKTQTNLNSLQDVVDVEGNVINLSITKVPREEFIENHLLGLCKECDVLYQEFYDSLPRDADYYEIEIK